MAILTLRNVSKVFGSSDNGSDQVVAVNDVSLDVQAGELFSIIGPSGCGKSTLLRIIGGLMPASSGELYVGTETVNGPHPWIGMVFQEESTFPWRTALANVEFGLEMRGVAQNERRAKAREMIRLVGLSGFEERYPSDLSGGMKQRVAIARALVLEPKILLMDEPFGALDEQTRIILGEELLRIRDQLKQTIMLVTHNINESVQLSDRVMIMTARPGRVKEVVAIDLPQPRDSSIIASDRFGRLVGSSMECAPRRIDQEFQTNGTKRIRRTADDNTDAPSLYPFESHDRAHARWLSPALPRAAAARTKIIVVVPHRILFTVALPVYIAQEKGFYRENNLDVDAVFTRGGGENVQAVVSGDAQIGLGTGTLAVISAVVKKAPIKIAAAEITGMDAFWYVQGNTPDAQTRRSRRQKGRLQPAGILESHGRAGDRRSDQSQRSEARRAGLARRNPRSLYRGAHRAGRRRLVGGAVSTRPGGKRRTARRRERR